jgi:pimeloyl-ACP methyl ester carboxylesterase
MKPHIVLLHGWGSRPDRWKSVSDILKRKGFIVNTPYLPGFNPDEPIDKPYTIDDYSLWLKDYIKNLNSPKVFLIGHSHGGRIIARYMFKYGQNVSKIVLIGSAGLPQTISIQKEIIKNIVSLYSENVYKIVPKVVYNLLQRLLYKTLGESDYMKLNKPMKITMNNMLHHNSTDDYKLIKVPTLLIWGKQDTYTPIATGKKLKLIIHNSSLITIEDGKHGLHLTHPDLIAKYIIDFLTL